MSTAHVKGHVKEAEGKIKEGAGKLVGKKSMHRKGLVEKSVAKKKVLYEDLKADFRKLA